MFAIEEKLGITHHENLYYSVKNARFLEILQLPEVIITRYQIDTNSYGEYLFISLTVPNEKYEVTFFSLGYHWYREMWKVNIWEYYVNGLYGNVVGRLSVEETLSIIEKRKAHITTLGAYAPFEKPSQSAVLYSLLADVGDEDSALSAMGDFE